MKITNKFSSPIPFVGGVRYLLNGCGDTASTLTTGHHRGMNIIAPNGGHKEMGVLEIVYESRDKKGIVVDRPINP